MPDTIASLKRKLRDKDTTERCGVVLKSGRVMESPNIHENPEQGFVIPSAFAHKHLKNIAGTWHTHPTQQSLLSQDDYLGFGQWPGITHYIVGVDGVRSYVADEDGLIEETGFAPH